MSRFSLRAPRMPESVVATRRDETSGDLVLRGVSKSFAHDLVVDDLSLEVPRGSFFALVGPSGCGKTTTLRMVAGLERPDAGQIIVGDRDITGLRAHERPGGEDDDQSPMDRWRNSIAYQASKNTRDRAAATPPAPTKPARPAARSPRACTSPA